MTFANWNPNSVSVICGVTWYVFVHHLPCHKKGIWHKLRQALDIFMQILPAINKVHYTAPFSLLKLLQSWFHLSASSVFDPVKFKARFLFCDSLSLLFIDTPLSLLQCFLSSKFSPSLSSWPKTLRAFESSSGWSFSPAFIRSQVFSFPDLSGSVARNLLHISLQIS